MRRSDAAAADKSLSRRSREPTPGTGVPTNSIVTTTTTRTLLAHGPRLPKGLQCPRTRHRSSATTILDSRLAGRSWFPSCTTRKGTRRSSSGQRSGEKPASRPPTLSLCRRLPHWGEYLQVQSRSRPRVALPRQAEPTQLVPPVTARTRLRIWGLL